MSKPWVIYSFSDPKNPELVRYVGKTCRKPERRVKEHLAYSQKPVVTHLTCWLRTLLAAGLKPLVSILEHGSADEDWAQAERKWIAYFRSAGHSLVNGTDGGEGGLGKPMSPEVKEKLRVANKGRRPSAETRSKMSAAKIGKIPVVSKESREKAVATLRASIASGKVVLKRSPESVEKAAEACRITWERKRAEGWVVPDNWSKFRPDNRGRPCSDERRKKIGDANRGRVMSEEARRKMSEAKKGTTPHNKGLDFHEARRLVIELGIPNLKEHHRLHAQGVLPLGIPKNPQNAYSGHPDWMGQPHFFGRSTSDGTVIDKLDD